MERKATNTPDDRHTGITVPMNIIHSNLYNILLAWVYRQYRVPGAEVNSSGEERDRYGTTAVGHGTVGIGMLEYGDIYV